MIDHDRKFIFVANCKTGTTSIVDALKIPGIKMHYPAWKLKTLSHIAPYWDEYYTFAFTRNPWDLVVSWWHYMSPGHKLKSFGYFLRHMHMSTPIKKWSWISNYDAISDRNDNVIVDFVGRFENLQNDVNRVCDDLKIQRVKVRRKNVTKHRKYTTYYDCAGRNIIGKRCWKDVMYLGYKYE
jgi:hypothetical protein